MLVLNSPQICLAMGSTVPGVSLGLPESLPAEPCPWPALGLSPAPDSVVAVGTEDKIAI